MSNNKKPEKNIDAIHASYKMEHPTKKIEHLVICGGGITFFISYGALKESHAVGMWNIEDIKSIHGTSAGAMMALLIALKYDWQTMDDYLIKRPWQSIFKFDMNSILGAFEKRGIFDISLIEDIFFPLLKGKDMSENITLNEIYERTGIELHVYATELNSFTLEDISYKTHPDWRVVDAVYCSCCLPGLFSPIVKENCVFTDGGFLLNYPVDTCLKNCAEDPDTVLGISRKVTNDPSFSDQSTLLDYFMFIVSKMIEKVSTFLPSSTRILHEIEIKCNLPSIYDIYLATSNQEERVRLIQEGVEAVKRPPRLFCGSS